ncbi:MAG: J domain-containing protein [Chitinophagaceae bacterium]
MSLKDHYTILELPPSASTDEVKKAYRRLAHQYHPDKRGNDPYAAAQFTAIKEAYETLTNPVKKDHYLQQRWYARSIGKKVNPDILTPVVLLKQLLELEQYTRRLDEHRMDTEGLYQYLSHLLSGETIAMLNGFGDRDINKQVVLLVLTIGRLLPWHFVPGLTDRLQKIITDDVLVKDRITHFSRQKKQDHYWETRKVWVVLLIVVLLCLGIFMIAGS